MAPSLSSGTSFGGEGGLLLQTCFSTAAVQAATSASGWTDGRLFWTRLGFCGLLSVVGFLGMGSHQPAFWSDKLLAAGRRLGLAGPYQPVTCSREPRVLGRGPTAPLGDLPCPRQTRWTWHALAFYMIL